MKPRKHYTFHQLSELTNVPFRATKILLTVGVDICVNLSFQSDQNPVNFKSWYSCSFKTYPTPGRRFAFRRLSELTNVPFRATKILLTVGVDICVNLSFQSDQNPVNFKSWYSCSFKTYPTPGRRFAFRRLSELTNVPFRATKTLLI